MKYYGACYIFAITQLILHLTLGQTLADCNVCHSGNPTACHNETAYSLCTDGKPTYDIIICPPNNVCTAQSNVCYPKETAVPLCESVNVGSRCGICDDSEQVFSCINETTIAFCFGNNEPDYTSIAYCPDNSVCDLNNPEFCSDVDKVEPSCREHLSTTTTIEPTLTTITTQKPTTTTTTILTEKPTTPTIATPKPTTTTKITTEKPTTTKITTEKPTTTTITTQKPTTSRITTKKPTTKTTITTEKPTTTTKITTEIPTTKISTEKPTTTTKEPKTTTENPTTTTKKPRDANTLCREVNKTGSFKPDDDPTCTKYVLCYERNGTLSGLLRVCDPGLYFHESTTLCQADKPAGCP